MTTQLLGKPTPSGTANDGAYTVVQSMIEGPQCCTPKWYLTRQEIEDHSPSRKDGIDLKKETQLRMLYCSFLQDLGKKLKVPQITIATAMMLCHRFYLYQSHRKNEWQTIATVSMFLACKVEETTRLLKDVVVVAYETMYRTDPAAAQRIKQKEIYERQKELIVIGETLLLATIAFDLNIQHPYKPLVAALKRLKISHNDLVKVAWNFVNDWLRTTLCLQYKPHYIAAGSMYLAAKFHKVKLPSESGKAWWMEFDVSPKLLEEVIQQMIALLEPNRRPVKASVCEKKTQATAAVIEKVSSSSAQCALSGSISKCTSNHGPDRESGVGRFTNSQDNIHGSHTLAFEDTCVTVKVDQQCQTSDCGSTGSVVEDGDKSDEGVVQVRMVEPKQTGYCQIVSVSVGFSEIDKNRIKDALKRRRYDRATDKVGKAIGDDRDSDAWIVRELEDGIELESTFSEKRQRWG